MQTCIDMDVIFISHEPNVSTLIFGKLFMGAPQTITHLVKTSIYSFTFARSFWMGQGNELLRHECANIWLGGSVGECNFQLRVVFEFCARPAVRIYTFRVVAKIQTKNRKCR